MSLHQLFSILRARRAAAGLILLVTLALALAWVLVRQPTYTARSPVLVDVRMDPVGGTALQGMVAPSYMATQIDIVKSDRVAERVLQSLPKNVEPISRWQEEAQSKRAPQAWLAHKLQTYLDVKPARESNIINIAYTGRTPQEAAMLANAFAQAYLDVSLEVKTNPAKRYADWFDDQVKASRERLGAAQDKLAAFQQEAGIVSSDPNSDFETAKLTSLTQQLAGLQTRGLQGTGGAETSGVVGNLRGEVARAEAKVAEAGETMGANHPTMQKLRAELASLRSRFSAESAHAGGVASNSAASLKARERELEKAINEQKNKVLGLQKQRGQLAVYQREVDSAQKAYEAVAASAAQSRLQAGANQTNVVRISSATEPTEKTGLSGAQTMAIAALGGMLLALAGALLLELANRRVRSVQDLELVTRLPILATIPAAGSSALATLRLANGPRRLALARSPA
ncbi:Wzz/FepE/Etk N-terminal domain-containing protein [Caenimonas aquaedulcis]|uniref:Chain length determinant protein EpsF n=1 Tax=Caenimonas aquaedulcis TaxID=2793270 RepID=A0A931MIK1_9BURK|nr:Wzz/FepE/Etk N-terminal domain-containing protein [Caenimonas aquaedulcis]MBG9390077.1 chain length determinant protein EpsF [Caenimonas aquaedulcis]